MRSANFPKVCQNFLKILLLLLFLQIFSLKLLADQEQRLENRYIACSSQHMLIENYNQENSTNLSSDYYIRCMRRSQELEAGKKKKKKNKKKKKKKKAKKQGKKKNKNKCTQPTGDLVIVNFSGQELTVFMNDQRVGTVKVDSQKRFKKVLVAGESKVFAMPADSNLGSFTEIITLSEEELVSCKKTVAVRVLGFS